MCSVAKERNVRHSFTYVEIWWLSLGCHAIPLCARDNRHTEILNE